MSEKTACTYCGARILWVETHLGNRMPIDAEPEQRFVLDASRSPMIARRRNTYTCHLETCPHEKGRGHGASG